MSKSSDSCPNNVIRLEWNHPDNLMNFFIQINNRAHTYTTKNLSAIVVLLEEELNTAVTFTIIAVDDCGQTSVPLQGQIHISKM